jgi:hypothetical protein
MGTFGGVPGITDHNMGAPGGCASSTQLGPGRVVSRRHFLQDERSEVTLRFVRVVARQRSSTFSTVASPPSANGVTWWSSGKPPCAAASGSADKRAAGVIARPHLAPDRSRVYRDRGAASPCRRGRAVAASFLRDRSASSASSAPSNIRPTSPSGIAWRRRSRARSNVSHVPRDAVN